MTEERFWSRVRKTDTCWLWLGQKDSTGYGRLWISRTQRMQAHRYLVKVILGEEIPKGSHLHHLCETRECVRRDHLEIVTARDHARHHNLIWTDELILIAIQEFARRYGRQPSALDWNPAMAEGHGHRDAVEIRKRFDAGLWPSVDICQKAFGSWANAVERAGFPRPYSGTRYPTIVSEP